ncbi:MAG: macro domain-containing protein [Burkholderiaceae bacterium]|nr:macro domain-containing protein [Burkholderiaceae bacterium]
MVTPTIVDGDLLDQQTDVIVNAWNRNIIPWWLLIPQGISGAIKRRAGLQPFFELGRMGAIPLGGAVRTGAGRLPYKAIIHVAGISMWWRSSAQSIQDSVVSAMALVNQHHYATEAFPIIGAGTGGFGEDGALKLMVEAFQQIDSTAAVTIVRFRKLAGGA